jgi:hypothetical protein
MRMRMAPTAHYASWITSLAFTVTVEVEPGRSLPTVAAPTDPSRGRGRVVRAASTLCRGSAITICSYGTCARMRGLGTSEHPPTYATVLVRPCRSSNSSSGRSDGTIRSSASFR